MRGARGGDGMTCWGTLCNQWYTLQILDCLCIHSTNKARTERTVGRQWGNETSVGDLTTLHSTATPRQSLVLLRSFL